MSWTHEGNRGTANSKTASDTLPVTLNADVDVGQILIMWVASDSTAAGIDGQAGTVDKSATYVVDDADNIWAQIWSAGGAGSNNVDPFNRVFAGIYICRVVYPLSNGDTVTFHQMESPVAKAASIHEFSIDRDTWARIQSVDYEPYWSPGNGDIRNLSLSLSRSQEYLAIHILAVEGPNTDAYTFPAGWTQISGDGTTGGADDSNAHIRGSFRLFTGSAMSIDVTTNTADRDLSTMLTFLTEVDFKPGGAPGEFPACEVLDDVNRADVNPLTGGQWLYSSTGGGLGGRGDGSITNAHFKIVGNEILVGDTAHDDNYGKYYWQDPLPCLNFEVWATMSQVPSDDSHLQGLGLPYTNQGNRGIVVGISGQDGSFPGPGYATALFRWSQAPSWPVIDDLAISFIPGSGLSSRAFIGSFTDGMKVGVQADGGRYYHAWVDRNTGHGWELWNTWDTLAFQSPFNYDAFGGVVYLALWVSGTSSPPAAADDFGGCYECFGPQIYRRVFD